MPMNDPEPPLPRDHYSETEAAKALGITLQRLHELLDEHIFNDGPSRPASIELNPTDLLLLSYWQKNAKRRHGQVLQMPRRKR